ncbi:hypothetical protein P153DRAFT_199625 [Dothidotthia symphoricarpi CBS 119687]|uniref:Nuclear pore assembly and biogenesis-domain-containing protein n=1 Tax=Dothidotthia symphoricarpi CBS 119687 TaxID=1392245 RepID=A0A6A6AI36_9PLEO|nr:uncharacterized protein P153DRAFT_199625 [Dothidotthia symphoricarpi CBS 119687]KAF2131609.1 hypothetical protein P153DRAFT_199625 [Dothidotthia symphoricarpi CBS 119687]
MEVIQDYITLLPTVLPASLASPILKFVTTSFGITQTLQSHLAPFLTRVITQPDVASIFALLVVFFISMKILDMMYRAVIFWVRMVFRLALLGAVVVLGLWVHNRGVDGFVADVQGLGEKWTGEYQRYSGEVKKFQAQKEDQIRMQAANKGRGYGR